MRIYIYKYNANDGTMRTYIYTHTIFPMGIYICATCIYTFIHVYILHVFILITYMYIYEHICIAIYIHMHSYIVVHIASCSFPVPHGR